MDEALREFVEETDERLLRTGQHLVELEERGAEAELVDELFRDFHTIKGNCGFFQFGTLQTLAHSGENLLTLIREGELAVSDAIVDTLLETVDAMQAILEGIRDDGEEPDGEWGELIVRLERHQRVSTNDDKEGGADSTEATAGAVDGSDSGERAAADPARTEQKTGEATEARPGGSGFSPSEGSIRVDVDLLDELMNQMTELILTRNQLEERFLDEPTDPELEQAYKKLDLVTSQLQETVMETRMQPVGRIWQRYPRMVRDLANERDKEIRLELEGAETELDKSLVERVSDPVTHLVRNAADHGIEPPEERVAAGKPAEGTIRITALQDEGRVKIRVADDGRGLDPDEIGEQAREQGLATAQELEELSDREIRQFLFHPGFSTVSEVTDLSGRGVGLDVVEQNVEEAGGSVRIESEPGEGTLVELRLPLTLAVVPALLLETRGQEFVLPQDDVRRLLRVDPEDPESALEFIHETPVLRVDDQLLPVICLDLLLGYEAPSVRERVEAGASLNVVVARSQRTEFALVVDAVIDTQDVVVKSLPELLQKIEMYAGAVIKGDRSVAIILGTSGIAERARIAGEEPEGRITDNVSAAEQADEQREERRLHDVLWCRSRDDGRIAIPLEMVERLEYVDRSEAHERGGARFIPYGDGLLPLVDIEEILPERRSEPRDKQLHRYLMERETLPVALYQTGSRLVGLVLTEFLDILETDLSDRRGVSRPGVAFCTMIEDQITEVVDIPVILEHSEIEI